jgi:hypothetical protein
VTSHSHFSEHITTVHTPTHPTAHGFDLMICRHLAHDLLPSRHSRSEEIIIPRAIVYLSADRAQWKMLLEAREACFGITAALQEFTKELEREMGKMAIARIMGDRDRVRKRVGKEWDDLMSRKRTRAENDLPSRKRTQEEIEDELP